MEIPTSNWGHAQVRAIGVYQRVRDIYARISDAAPNPEQAARSSRHLRALMGSHSELRLKEQRNEGKAT